MTRDRPAVLQVITDDDRRGAQVFATQLHAALVDLEFDVLTVALAPGRHGGLGVPLAGPTRRSPRTILGLRRLARGRQVVVAHGSTTLFMCAAAFPRRRFVYRQISDSTFWASSRAKRLRVRVALKMSRHVVALWDGAAQALTHLGVGADKVTVIPNAVPAFDWEPQGGAMRTSWRAQLGVAETDVVFTYVGSLVSEKGVDQAIRAAASVRDCHLVVVGDGPIATQLSALAEAEIPGRHHFLGQVSTPRDALGGSDVFVFPTRGGDSMPAAVIEASLAGLPVVATRDQAIPEIVLDGQTGILTEPNNTLDLASAMQFYASNPARRRGDGERGRAHCLTRFDMAVVAVQWARVVASVGV